MPSLLSPPAHLARHLLPLWPWIWLQCYMVQAWLRRVGGPEDMVLLGLTKGGRVVITQMYDGLTGQKPVGKPFAIPPSPCLALALSPVQATLFYSDLPLGIDRAHHVADQYTPHTECPLPDT